MEEAWPGDIIGLHNHGTIQIGDTFTEGEELKYEGIPYFAPELFRRVVLRDPLRMKALQKGVVQLSEEGATQVFRPLKNNDLILGAVGILQFDVAAYPAEGRVRRRCRGRAGRRLHRPLGRAATTPRCWSASRKRPTRTWPWTATTSWSIWPRPGSTWRSPMERWPDIRFLATREL